MVSNTTRLSALLLAHVFEKYVDSVEDGNLLDDVLARYFPTFEIDVFFEHVYKMQVMCLANGHTCSRNTTNALPRCPKFAHVFEKGAKSAAGRDKVVTCSRNTPIYQKDSMRSHGAKI